MQQDIALKILKENRQALADEYDIENIGVFPYEENSSANCKCECGRCCGYHPQIGVAVEYKSGVEIGLFELGGLQMHISDLFGCDAMVDTLGRSPNTRYQEDDDYMKDIVYVE